MDRLDYIFNTCPEWGLIIIDFINQNPEFEPYLKYVTLNQFHSKPFGCITIKDLMCYYVSFAGVNANYGQKVFNWVRSNQLQNLTEKKRLIIESINRLPEINTRQQFDNLPKIKGVGEGCISFIYEEYFHDINSTYPTDRVFQHGLKIIYQLSTITISDAKNLISQWKGLKSVGTMFCFQVANYAK